MGRRRFLMWLEPASDGAAPVPHVVEPASDGAASVPNLVAPVMVVIASVPFLISDVIAAGGEILLTAAVAVPKPLAQVLVVIASVQFLVSDVIAAGGEILLTAAHGTVVALTQLASAVSSFFGVAGLGPVASPPAGVDGAGPAVAADASVLAASSQLPAPWALAGIPGVPLVGHTAGVTALGGIGTTQVDRDSSLTATAAPARDGPDLMDGPSKVVRAFGEALKSASVWALIAVVLPGLCGLSMLTGGGVHLGHRQAKFGFALQTGGIARFAHPGPLGVVRSGSFGCPPYGGVGLPMSHRTSRLTEADPGFDGRLDRGPRRVGHRSNSPTAGLQQAKPGDLWPAEYRSALGNRAVLPSRRDRYCEGRRAGLIRVRDREGPHVKARRPSHIGNGFGNKTSRNRWERARQGRTIRTAEPL